MISRPEYSPWGEIQRCELICIGVFEVSTASHGGIMVSRDMTAVLSPVARKCGMKYRGYLCYEEDSEEGIVYRELMDKKLWAIPGYIQNKAAFEEYINNSLRRYHPEYWRARQAGKEREAERIAAPVRAHGAEL